MRCVAQWFLFLVFSAAVIVVATLPITIGISYGFDSHEFLSTAGLYAFVLAISGAAYLAHDA